MDKNELPKTVTTILNGHNYVLWSQDMRSFLKGHRLWRYVTGEIQAPVRSKDEEDTNFADRLEDWDCKNHQIITWFRHSTVPSIHQQFGRYENAKDSIWDQMEQSTHIVKDPADAAILATKRDQFHLIQFLMALTSEFEPVRATLLQQVPLPTLEFAMSQLLSHETRLRTLQPHHPDAVLATVARPSSSSSSRNGLKYCKNCHKQGHLLAECPTIQCRYCHKIGHIVYNCPTKPPKLGQSGILPRPVNHSVAAAAEDSPASPQKPAPPVDPVTDQTHLLPLRRSDRVRAPPAHLRDYSCFSAVLSLHEPHTYREACTNPLWQQAMTEELQALEKTHTWDLVDLPHGKSAIGCKWVYKIKTKSDGSIERYKARLVAKGYAQEYGIDYEETFAPVARITSVRSLLAITAVHPKE
uniref:CCHC-type domain-containing protein n=1 Tax=Fagus sylvatica TaxID=28930 RepID=A0A2N9FKW5_FAGSY